MRVDLDLRELNEWLLQFLNFEHEPNWELLKLTTMEKLCEYFGHPEKVCPCFHVAGSKGKGTIAANIAGILRAAGYRTGVYASPHILHYTERVGTGAGPFTQEVYDMAFAELRSGVEELLQSGELLKDDISWFELSTVFAMLCFRTARVDYAVYEVGMGGRLDATNVVQPQCAVFGPIELEHTEYLGDTLTEIAGEKAGILKAQVPAVSVHQDSEAERVLRQVAQAKGAQIEFCAPQNDYVAEDREVAWQAVKKVLPEVSHEIAERAMAEVQLPGRYEKISKIEKYSQIPYILLDMAHTPNSMRQALMRMKRDGVRGKLLFGCFEDKKFREMVQMVVASGIFTDFYVTRPGEFRKVDLIGIGQAFRDTGVEVTVDEDYTQFIPKVLTQTDRERMPLIVLGSAHLAGEVKKRL